ncbi:MAG TPA: hypothetical protein VM582_08745, partial [Candidatus Thermoplasmatota archaeon]|nr:hypothetical protein [Candidatus Thermoplasmatota archaeon]
MGLSTTATHAIWFIAIITAGAMATDAYFEVAEALDDARRARDALAQARMESAVAAPHFCWDGTKLRVSATNVGRATIDAQNVSVVVDGLVVPGFVANVERARGTGFWEPGYNATFNKTGVSSEPDRVVLFTPGGTAVYPEKRLCPTLNL